MNLPTKRVIMLPCDNGVEPFEDIVIDFCFEVYRSRKHVYRGNEKARSQARQYRDVLRIINPGRARPKENECEKVSLIKM